MRCWWRNSPRRSVGAGHQDMASSSAYRRGTPDRRTRTLERQAANPPNLDHTRREGGHAGFAPINRVCTGCTNSRGGSDEDDEDDEAGDDRDPPAPS